HAPHRPEGEGRASRREGRFIQPLIIRRASPTPFLPARGRDEESHRRRSNENETKSSRLGRIDRGVVRPGQLLGLPAPDAGGSQGPPGGPAGGQGTVRGV